MDYASLLGKNRHDADVRAFLTRLGDPADTHTDEDTQSVDLMYPALGEDLRLDADGRLETIFLSGPGNESGYATYGGPLPKGVLFGWSSVQLNDALGPPTRTGMTHSILSPGDTVCWDRYDASDTCLHSQYRGVNGPLNLVTIMTSASAPRPREAPPN